MSNKVIQYYHSQYFARIKHTTMVHVPSKDELWDAILNFKDINLIVGSVKKHPKDQFVKKIGRDLAMKKSKIQTFSIKSIKKVENMYKVTLNNKDRENETLNIELEIKNERNTVYLVGSQIKYISYGDWG